MAAYVAHFVWARLPVPGVLCLQARGALSQSYVAHGAGPLVTRAVNSVPGLLPPDSSARHSCKQQYAVPRAASCRVGEHPGGASHVGPRQQQQQGVAAGLVAEELRLHYAQAQAAAAAAGAGIVEAPSGLEAVDKLPHELAVRAVAAGLGLGASSLLDVQDAETCTRQQASIDGRVSAAAGPGVTAGAAGAAAAVAAAAAPFAVGGNSWNTLSSASEVVEAVAQSPTKLGPGSSPDSESDGSLHQLQAELASLLAKDVPGDPPSLSSPATATQQEARDGPPAADDEQTR